MSLLNDLNGVLSDDPEIDSWSLANAVNAEYQETEFHDEHRWYTVKRVIFTRDDGDGQIYVEGYYQSPNTEMQEIEKEWTFGWVVPKIVEVIIYESSEAP